MENHTTSIPWKTSAKSQQGALKNSIFIDDRTTLIFRMDGGTAAFPRDSDQK